jgi:aryl-alcohol dehydrogenase-like predicted oxidoreductase
LPEAVRVAVDGKLFVKSGSPVTRVGLGGEGVLRSYGREPEALAVIEEAKAQGINYFDSAKAYAGSEGYYGEFWARQVSNRTWIFQTSKSASRDREGANTDLRSTLRIMEIEQLDLWQIHDVRTWGRCGDDRRKKRRSGGFS